MKRDLLRFGRTQVAFGALAVLLAACGGSPSVPASASAAPSASAAASAAASSGAFDLAKIEASVAYIQTQGTFVTADGAKEQVFSGSGFVVDPSGLIVTNNHVVTGGAFWKVSIGSDKTLMDAQLVGVSECSDLAVLKVAGTFPALPLAAANATVGEQIYVAGHPNGDPYTLTNGIVAKPAAPADTSWASVKNEIQITAQTYPGNSGSPVVDASGQVVGVQYAGGTAGSSIAGESFAIAASEAKGIIDQIKANGNLDYIGLNGQVNADNTGIAVISVAPGSPADKAGISAGDLLTNFNGTSVGTDGTKSTYCSVLRSHKADATFSVTVSRGGQTLTGEINGRPLVATASSAPPSSAPSTSASSGIGSIDQLQAFVPASIWSTCQPTTPEFATTVQAASCTATGTDGVFYDLYNNSTDLKAAVDTIVQKFGNKPSTKMSTDCATGAWSGAWNWTGQTADPGNSLLCGSNSNGYAWVVQADPKINVLFQVQIKTTDGTAVYKWWLANATVVEPGN